MSGTVLYGQRAFPGVVLAAADVNLALRGVSSCLVDAYFPVLPRQLLLRGAS